jgi:hypothetical protein
MPQFLAGGAQVPDRCHELAVEPDAQQDIKQEGDRNKRYPD